MSAKQVDLASVIHQTRTYLAYMLLVLLVFQFGAGIWLLNGNAKSYSSLYAVSIIMGIIALVAVCMALFRTDILARMFKHLLNEHHQLQRVNQQLNADLSSRNQQINGLQQQLHEQSQADSEKQDELARLRKQIEKVESLEAAVLAVYQKDIAMPLETVFKLFGVTGTTPQDARYRQQILSVISNLRSRGKLIPASYGDANRLRIAQ